MTTTAPRWRLPHDLDVERAILAELAQPLHVVHALGTIGSEHFADPTHIAIAAALRTATPLTDDQAEYVAACVTWADPITSASLAIFLAHVELRAEVLALARRIDDLIASAT